MTEKFNRGYRRFAEAARDAAKDRNRKDKSGFANPTYRESIGEDPDILWESASKELKESISVDALLSFLKMCSGDRVAGIQDIFRVGHFLHNHRTEIKDREGRPNPPLSPEDRRLMNLACKLIENAFYRGDFLRLPAKQCVALVFVVNTIAKIFEQDKSKVGLQGFDRERLKGFFDAVGVFENERMRALTPQPAPRERGRKRDIFNKGLTRAIRFLGLEYLLPYYIKNVLIIDNYLSAIPDEEQRRVAEEDLSSARLGNLKSRGLKPGDKLPVYSMLSKQEGSRTRDSANIRLHFLPEDIPFCVSVRRYLQFKTSMRGALKQA